MKKILLVLLVLILSCEKDKDANDCRCYEVVNKQTTHSGGRIYYNFELESKCGESNRFIQIRKGERFSIMEVGCEYCDFVSSTTSSCN